MKTRVKKQNFKKRSIRMLIALGVLVVLFVTLTLLTFDADVCEFFSRTFSRWWITAFGTLLGWIPISLYEFLLIFAILGALAFVVAEIVLLCKHKWRTSLTLLLAVSISVFAFLNIYTTSASFAYNRAPLPNEVYEEYSGDDLSVDEAEQIAFYVIREANEAYHQTEHDEDSNIVFPYSLAEMSDIIAKEYDKLQNDYFSPYTPHGKKVLNTTIMSELDVTGVFFAPFGEANVNVNSRLFLPHTLAHEMAHGKGVMREYEADLVANYICLTSDDPYIRYGALVRLITPAISMVALFPDTTQVVAQLYSMVDVGISTERNNYTELWRGFNTLDKIGKFFNDLYLKLQKQEEGTGSYTKPGEVHDTGEKDTFDKPVVHVIRFSDAQNVLIKLFKQGKLS